ncbi:MAG TPA: AraC family transcriptional regulator [Polyangiaceae bacterium]|nr:AraC family transcriptional regulator [Polyangiaceae bacterium]
MADQLGNMGIDVDRVLRQSGLSANRLDDRSLVITFPTFQKLVLSALSLSGEQALGLLVGERLLASSHGMVGYAALSSGTIRQALELVERYVPLRTSLVAISHSESVGEVQVRFRETRPLGKIQRPVLEAIMLSIMKILDGISMGACQVRLVAFPFDEPEYAALARDLFRCDVRYGQSWAGAVLPLDVVDAPLKMGDPEAFREAALICQRELDKLVANESMAARVRRLLLEGQNGFPSLQVAARMFHMTPRTLHRRLVAEGTSFRELLEDVRRTLALEHVKSGRLSIEEIAYMLGYTDLANFRRAFRRWESVPPSAYRRPSSARRGKGDRGRP